MKIFIDAGHNYSGADTGAQGNGLREQDVTFQIADKLRALLAACGHEVKMSRDKVTDSLGISLSDSLHTRAGMANQWGAQLFVSIHCNAFDGIANGTETFVYSFGGQAAAYAERIQKAIVRRLGTSDRGVKEWPDLVVLCKTSMPAVLVETAFIDNAEDSLLLKNQTADFAEAIFEGITGGTTEGFGIQCVKEEKPLLTSANDIVWELNHSYFPIAEIEGFVQALDTAKKKGSPLYWGYYKLVNQIK